MTLNFLQHEVTSPLRPQVDARIPMTAKGDLRLLILAPAQSRIPARFHTVHNDAQTHASLLAEMQRLRGRIYLEDGAIQASQLTRDGLHCQSIDRRSWHLLALSRSGEICGCVRYYSHPNHIPFKELWVNNSAIATSLNWGLAFRTSVEWELLKARRRGVSFVEVGGWAIAPERRCSPEALRTALATYSLAQLLGGCIGITTATVRHCSSSILRRIGGASLETPYGELPPYFDPRYNCEMEVLRFDSASPAGRFAEIVNRMCLDIVNVPIVCESPVQWQRSNRPVPAYPAWEERSFQRAHMLQPA